jgi:serine/threonine protein kinase
VCVELELEKVIGMGQFGVVLEVTAIYNDRRDGGSRLWRSHRNLLPPTPSSVDDGNSVDTPRNMNMNTPHTVPNVKELLEKSQEIVHCSHARRQSLSEQQQQQQQETMRKQQLLQSTSGTSSFDTNSSKEEDYIHDLRNYMSLHYLRKSDGVPRYAVKQIRKDLYPKKKVEAAVELAREAYLLGCLHHAHIIQLKATVSVPGHVDFMIVLERLSNGTLYDKLMVEWKAAQVQVSSSSGGGRFLVNLWLQHNNSNTNKNSRRHNIANITHTLLMDRLMALYDLSNALAYLHSKM